MPTAVRSTHNKLRVNHDAGSVMFDMNIDVACFLYSLKGWKARIAKDRRCRTNVTSKWAWGGGYNVALISPEKGRAIALANCKIRTVERTVFASHLLTPSFAPPNLAPTHIRQNGSN